MRGWLASMMNFGEAYPSRCVSVNDTLMWGDSLACTYDDGAGQPIISVTDGWYYIPIMKKKGKPLLHAQETYLHGTPLRNLWSVLAHGDLIGTMYQTGNDASKSEPCVWVTHEAGEASSYSPGSHLGDGYWFQFMVCVSRELVDNYPARPRGSEDRENKSECQETTRTQGSPGHHRATPERRIRRRQNAFPAHTVGSRTKMLSHKHCQDLRPLCLCFPPAGEIQEDCQTPSSPGIFEAINQSMYWAEPRPRQFSSALRGHANQLSYSEC